MRVIKRGQHHPIGWALRHNRREKEIWAQHSSLSVSWQCLQYDQIPHDPSHDGLCALKLRAQTNPSFLKLLHQVLSQEWGANTAKWCGTNVVMDLTVWLVSLWNGFVVWTWKSLQLHTQRSPITAPVPVNEGAVYFFSEFSLCLKRRFQVFRVALTCFWEQGLPGWVWAPGLGAEHSLPKAELPLTSFYSAF